MRGQAAAERGRATALTSRLSGAVGSQGAPSEILAAQGGLEVRLAASPREIRSAQKLRFRVFFEEGGAEADPTARRIRRDVCRFDRVCDHLIVVDNAMREADGAPAIVGAYRLLRQDVADAHFGFYSAAEFDVAGLIARHPGKRFLELGRSCVAAGYRGKRTVELLWRGVWAYARRHGADAMFGCASLPGARPDSHAAALRFLSAEGGADPAWAVEPTRRTEPARMVDAGELDARAALRDLPPLIKGYWRLGAHFSASAVADEAFGTTDVFVVLPVADIEQRYLAYFAPKAAEPPLAA